MRGRRDLSEVKESKIVYRLVVAVLLLLTAALIIIPNRYWVAASK